MYDFNQSLGKLTLLVSKALGHRLEQKLAHQGISITAAQWSIISMLHTRTNINQKDIASHLELDKVMVKRLVDQLERSGLVVRLVSDADRRANYINLTEKGHRVYGGIEGYANDVLDEAYHNIPKKNQQLVFETLEQIYDNLKRAELRG